MSEHRDSDPQAGTRCASCGAEFLCGMQAGQAECWCARLAPIAPPLGPAAGCLCPRCLETEIRRRPGDGAE